MTEYKNYVLLTHLYNNDLYKDCNKLCEYYSLIGIYDIFSTQQLYNVDNNEDIYEMDIPNMNINYDIISYSVYYKKLVKKIEKNMCLDISDILNYKTIIKNDSYIKPEIGYFVKLKCGKISVIKKTFWLKIFQRKFRKYFISK